MWMLTAALFIIAKTLKLPRCPLIGEWINKLWHIQTMEYYSVLKRNELLSHEKIWSNFKGILLSERSQSKKATNCMSPTIGHCGKDTTRHTVKRLVVATVLWGGNDE